MKLLFVTGGEECGCKGKGWIEQPVWVTATVSVTVRTQCRCVEAREATIETFKVRLPQRNIQAGKDEMIPVMVNRVVPKGEVKDFHMVMSLKIGEPEHIWEQFRLLVPMHYRSVVPQWAELPADVQRAFAKPIDNLRYIVKAALKNISRQL